MKNLYLLLFVFLSIYSFSYAQDDVYDDPQPAPIRNKYKSEYDNNSGNRGYLMEYDYDGYYESGMYSNRLNRMYNVPTSRYLNNQIMWYNPAMAMGYSSWNYAQWLNPWSINNPYAYSAWNDPFFYSWNNPFNFNAYYDPFMFNSCNSFFFNSWNNPWARPRVVYVTNRNNGWTGGSTSPKKETNNPRGFGRFDETYRPSPSKPTSGNETFGSPASRGNGGRYSTGGSEVKSSGSFGGFGGGSSSGVSSGGARNGNNGGRTGRF